MVGGVPKDQLQQQHVPQGTGSVQADQSERTLAGAVYSLLGELRGLQHAVDELETGGPIPSGQSEAPEPEPPPLTTAIENASDSISNLRTRVAQYRVRIGAAI